MKEKGDVSGKVNMTPKKMLRQILDYYKFPVFIVILVIYVAGYMIYRNVNHKDAILYTALVNVAQDAKLEGLLTTDYLDQVHSGGEKQMVNLYKGWYLTDDEDSEHYQYVYATGMKILASIDAGQLDVVLMNKEAFDAFAQNGYLEELPVFLPDEMYEALKPYAVKNIEILEDNAEDMKLKLADEYKAEVREYEMGLDVTGLSIFKDKEWDGDIYMGFVRASERKDEILKFTDYMFNDEELQN